MCYSWLPSLPSQLRCSSARLPAIDVASMNNIKEEIKGCLEMYPKFLCGGAGWTAGGICVDQHTPNHSACGYSSATGFGEGIGVGVGQIIIQFTTLACFKGPCPNVLTEEQRKHIEKLLLQDGYLGFLKETACVSGFYGCAGVAAGASWQPIVDHMLHITAKLAPKLAVTLTITTTGVACGLAFLIALIAYRATAHKLSKHAPGANSWATFQSDFKLSMWNVAGAASAFLLTHYVGAFDPTSSLGKIFFSGLSTLIGYNISQGFEQGAKAMLIYLGKWEPETGFSCCSITKQPSVDHMPLLLQQKTVKTQPRAGAEHMPIQQQKVVTAQPAAVTK